MRFCLLLLALPLFGCATYQSKVEQARTLLASDPNLAAEKLKPLAEEESGDQLVYLLDYAMALQLAEQYEESKKAFIAADKMAEQKDYHSVSRVAGSLLLNEGMVQYKGDDYEKLFINVFSAINYLLTKDFEGAGVETRRLTEKLKYFRTEEKKPYQKNNPFALYMNAHIWEANQNWDSALIDFENAYEIGVNNELIQQDLLRAASRARRYDKLKKYQKEFSIKSDDTWKKPNHGELVLIFQQGWGPRKRPRPEAPRFPMLAPTYNMTQSANMHIDGFGDHKSYEIFDVQSVAIRTLDDQMGPLIAKRIAGMVAKRAAADKIGDQNGALGALAFVAMHVSDQADLRQWSTLPQTLQVARAFLPAGKHQVSIQGQTNSGGPTGENLDSTEVEIKAGKKTFILWRSYK